MDCPVPFSPVFISPDAIIMRLTSEQVQLIWQTAGGTLGAGVQVTLFGNNYDN